MTPWKHTQPHAAAAMPVPSPSIPSLLRRALRAAPLLLLGLPTSTLPAATRQPARTIPLDTLGYTPFPASVLNSGASILTLDYVDDQHMLVTFHLRRLLKRIPDDPPEDLDRNIDAVLLDLPSGNVLARTSWRVHDAAQYLWPLGHGQFLLRVRDRLTVIAPLRHLKAEGGAFREQPLLSSPRAIGAVLLSPDASLLILETLDRRPPPAVRSPSPGTQAYAAAQAAQAANQAAVDGPAPASRVPPVQIHFFRLRPRDTGDGLFAQSAGSLGARTLVSIPADGSGFLSILDQGHQHWAFNFNHYRGRVEELSPFDSTCHPHPLLVSRSEFIAFGCRTGNQRQMFGGFNLRGEEMWEQAIPENYLSPGFAFAPAAGRFAFGRVIASSVVGDPDSLSIDATSSQVVTVFQTETGKQILRLDCSPIIAAGQNFTLSPDGSDLAIIRNSAIEIHHLPALSGKDREAVAMATSLAPEPGDGPVLLAAPLTNASARAATSAGTPVATPPTDPHTGHPTAIVDNDTITPSTNDALAPTPDTTSPPTNSSTPAATTATAPPPPPTPNIIQNGDAQPQVDVPRKRPTLYTPDDHPPTNPKDKDDPKDRPQP